ncbi:MAG: outer membrane protein assembly factor BamD [Bacteroidales bacterium]|nr:outer membrane protein assembly factor BamD [Bacteroidales bacterium]
MKFGKTFTTMLVTLLLLASCDGYEKIIKGNDFDAKYKAAVEYYEGENYNRALQLLENLMLHYHGKENAENIAWYYAQSLLKTNDYYSAGYQFKSFFKRYPYSDRAEEALYLAADCKYQESPDYYLDQKLTKEAIQEYESFVDRYPTSVHIPEINNHLDELRNKLMLKDYENAYNYYHTENYHAAYVSLQAFINNYPDSPLREKAMYYMLASGYTYGINSQESKMMERLQQVINDFDRFSASFSESKYLESAQGFYTKSKAAIAQLEAKQKSNN